MRKLSRNWHFRPHGRQGAACAGHKPLIRQPIVRRTGVDHATADDREHGLDLFDLFVRDREVRPVEHDEIRELARLDRSQGVLLEVVPSVASRVEPKRVLARDLLVRDDQLGQIRSFLVQLGFVGLQNWGDAPHHFFVVYDQTGDCWLKLDVVTEVAHGKPIHALRTTLAAGRLGNRGRCGPVVVPSPELVTAQIVDLGGAE